MSIRISAKCKATAPAALVAGLLISGCATPRETGLFTQYRTIDDTLYAESNTADQPAPFDSTSTFADYLAYSFAHNPGLKASFNKWKAALERVPQARSLDDPELSFEYLIEQLDQQYKVGLTQRFPTFGKLRLRTQQASAKAEAAMHQFETDRFMLYDQTATGFYEYHYLAQSTAIAEETVRLLTDLEETVAIQYENGKMPFSALITAQVEKERSLNQLESLRDQRRVQSSALAALLNLKTVQLLPWPAIEPSTQSFLEEEFFLEMLEDLNPELKEAEAQVSAKQYGEQLARREVLPDLMAGANWMTMANGKSDVGLMAGITLPIWLGKNRAAIRESEAELSAAMNHKQDLYNQLRTELSVAVFKARDAGRRVDLFRQSLIPKAEQALQVVQQEFSNGELQFKQLIDAQRTLLEFRLMEQRAIVDREIALAEIGCCIGQFDLHADLSSETESSEEGTSL